MKVDYRIEGKHCVCVRWPQIRPNLKYVGKLRKMVNCSGRGNNTVTVRLDSIAKELCAVVGQSSDGIGTSVELAPRVVVECAVLTSARIVDSNFDVFCNCKEGKKKESVSKREKTKEKSR